MKLFQLILFFVAFGLEWVEGRNALGSWKGWGQWTDCSVSCGKGSRMRHRLCAVKTFAIRPRSYMPLCDGEESQKMMCRRYPCREDSGLHFYKQVSRWALWNGWSLPDRTCGGFPALVTRSRECKGPFCQGVDRQSKHYRLRSCPINGNWGVWSSWSKSSRSCGEAEKVTKARRCDNPSAAHGGRGCEGRGSESKMTEMKHCPIDGAWSKWSEWSGVARTCGQQSATRSRSRSCTQPSPAFGGRRCEGADEDKENVPLPSCPINGGWSKWSRWSKVSETCAKRGMWVRGREGGIGVRGRGRRCDSPSPANAGRPCVGEGSQLQQVTLKPCPIDGAWSRWSEWSGVARTCGQQSATRSRSRSCTQPSPAFGGKRCEGADEDKQQVPLPRCPIDGAWSRWSEWSGVPRTCGPQSATRSRSRSCTQPSPAFGGRRCEGADEDKQQVPLPRCPVDGAWSKWTGWTEPPVTCSEHPVPTTRNRFCDNPSASFGGRSCQGDNSQAKQHYLPKCEIDGQWCEWSRWSRPSHTCGDGSVNRRRFCSQPRPSRHGKACSGANSQSKDITGRPCTY